MHAKGAETWGMATDGARDGAEMQGAQRGGAWAHVRGVDMGEMHGRVICTPRGPGCMWCMHEGCGNGQWSMVCGPGTEAAVLPGDRPREVQWLRQVAWPGAT